MSPRRVVSSEPLPDDLDDIDMSEDEFDQAYAAGHTGDQIALGSGPTLTIASGSTSASVGGGTSISVVTQTTRVSAPVAA
ncbi:MAG: hypothetical protein ACFCVG_15785 [Kineosporiaceae bacterium]